VAEPLSTDRLFDLYKIAIDEYRFQVKLNWDRTTYHFTLSSGLLAIATGILRLGTASAVNLIVAVVFLIGFCVSWIGIETIRQSHQYYRNTIVKKTLLEDQLGLTLQIKDYHPVHTLAIGTTPGQAEHLQIIHNTQEWLARPARGGSITARIIAILRLFCFLNLVGAIVSICLYIQSVTSQRAGESRRSSTAHFLYLSANGSQQPKI
jgi:hypothetical protein